MRALLSCQAAKWMSWEQLLRVEGLGAPGDTAAARAVTMSQGLRGPHLHHPPPLAFPGCFALPLTLLLNCHFPGQAVVYK